MLGSIIFTVLMFVAVVPYSLAVILVRPFGYPAAYGCAVAWARLVLWLARKLCGLNFEVQGRENLPQKAAVVMMKHSSTYETIVQFVLLPRGCWVLKRELMWAPFLGWALAALHPIAIDRKGGHNAVAQVVQQGKERLRDGLCVLIFPEGTRMPPGETRRYGISGTLLAQEAECVMVPVAHNAGDFWPRRGLRKRPGIVSFRIGPPVNPAGLDARAVSDDLQRWMEQTIAELRAG